MEFFQLQFAQLVETWIIFQSLDFRILLLLFDLVIFLRKWKGCSFSNCLISRKSSITIDSTIIVQISFVYLARCAQLFLSNSLYFFFFNHIFYPLLEYFLTNSFTFFSRNSHTLRIDEIKKKNKILPVSFISFLVIHHPPCRMIGFRLFREQPHPPRRRKKIRRRYKRVTSLSSG